MEHAAARPARRQRSGLVARLGRMFALRRDRRALARLDNHLLKDIGLTPYEARHESARPFWDAPPHWRD